MVIGLRHGPYQGQADLLPSDRDSWRFCRL